MSSVISSLVGKSTFLLDRGFGEHQFLWNLEACIARTSSSLAERDLRSTMDAGTGNLLSMTWYLRASDQTQRCLVTEIKRFDVCEEE